MPFVGEMLFLFRAKAYFFFFWFVVPFYYFSSLLSMVSSVISFLSSDLFLCFVILAFFCVYFVVFVSPILLSIPCWDYDISWVSFYILSPMRKFDFKDIFHVY